MHSGVARGGPIVTGVKHRVIKFYCRRELNAAALSYGLFGVGCSVVAAGGLAFCKNFDKNE